MMDKFYPLLKYLETVNSSRDFVLRGKIPSEKTPLRELQGLGKLGFSTFSVSFSEANNLVAISEQWIKENEVVFDSISWSQNTYSAVHIYLNSVADSIYIKSTDGVFITKVGEYAQQIGFRTICAN